MNLFLLGYWGWLVKCPCGWLYLTSVLPILIFLRLLLELLLPAVSSGLLLSSSPLEENFLFLEDTSVSCLFKVTNWFLFEERFLLLGKISSRSLLTSPSLEKYFLFLGLDNEIGRSFLPFSWGSPGAFPFSCFWVFYLSPHTPLVYYCCFLRMWEQLQPATLFPSWPNISSPIFQLSNNLSSCFLA